MGSFIFYFIKWRILIWFDRKKKKNIEYEQIIYIMHIRRKKKTYIQIQRRNKIFLFYFELLGQLFSVCGSLSDPLARTDPDPPFFLKTDSDPTFFQNTDPDPTFFQNTDPDLATNARIRTRNPGFHPARRNWQMDRTNSEYKMLLSIETGKNIIQLKGGRKKNFFSGAGTKASSLPPSSLVVTFFSSFEWSDLSS